jgi:hypothetical protein
MINYDFDNTKNFYEYKKYSVTPEGSTFRIINDETGKPIQTLSKCDTFASAEEAQLVADNMNDRVTQIPTELLERRNYNDAYGCYKSNGFEAWYDTSLKLWTVTLRDKDGNQIGLAEYFNNRDQYRAAAVMRNNERCIIRGRRLKKLCNIYGRTRGTA